MRITCPNCDHSKQIDPVMLPPNATRVTCPQCGESFELQRIEPRVADEPRVDPSPATDFPLQPVTAAQPVEADTLPKAGFWLRVVATLIDTFLLFCLQFVLGFLLAMAGVISAVGGDKVGGVVLLFGYIISYAYYIVFTGHGGQTPGKMALRIKVIRRDGSDIGYGRAAFREVVGKFVSAIILGIGYLMVAFDDQKRGLHDRMADTYVIKL